jgi:hypothetical protein
MQAQVATNCCAPASAAAAAAAAAAVIAAAAAAARSPALPGAYLGYEYGWRNLRALKAAANMAASQSVAHQVGVWGGG